MALVSLNSDPSTSDRTVAFSRRRPSPSWLLVVALVLTGLTMRTAITSVGSVLDELRSGLHINSATAGVVTALPVLIFAVAGSLAPRASRRFGTHRLLVVALSLMTLGLVLRALAGSILPFMLFSVLALLGGAVSNVVMPSLVKQHFPDKIGLMTASYTTALAVGMTAAAGLSVPIGRLAPDGNAWRLSIGVWALLSLLAVLPWLATLRHDQPAARNGSVMAAPQLVRSRTAWAMAVFFGAISYQAYVGFGWFAEFFRAHGANASQAGWLVAFFAALSIPSSMIMPTLAVRGQRLLVIALATSTLVAYVGLSLAGDRGAWLWMFLAGVGGGTFPLSLTMMGLRTRHAAATAALSAFSQSIGYLIAGTGPLLVGLLLGATGGWAAPMATLYIMLAVGVVSGLIAARPVFVEDEVYPPLDAALAPHPHE
jgi:MFS transporter, CP family, cyanate transporter